MAIRGHLSCSCKEFKDPLVPTCPLAALFLCVAMGAAVADVVQVAKTYWPLLLGNALEWYELCLQLMVPCGYVVVVAL